MLDKLPFPCNESLLCMEPELGKDLRTDTVIEHKVVRSYFVGAGKGDSILNSACNGYSQADIA